MSFCHREVRDKSRQGLLEILVGELLAGRPTLYTYKAAVAAVLGHAQYAQGYGAQLTKLATKSKEYEVEALGC